MRCGGEGGDGVRRYIHALHPRYPESIEHTRGMRTLRPSGGRAGESAQRALHRRLPPAIDLEGQRRLTDVKSASRLSIVQQVRKDNQALELPDSKVQGSHSLS